MAYIISALLSAAVGFVVWFLSRLYAARQVVWKMQKANVPMPEYHFLFGHLLLLKKTMDTLPADAAMQRVMKKILEKYPSGVMFFDLWPFSAPLLVLSSPGAATQVAETHNLDKPPSTMVPLEKINGGPTILTMRGTLWKKWRSVFNRGFSPAYQLGLAPRIADEVAVFCRLLRERVKRNEPFQLEDMTLRLMFDIMGSVTMDTPLNHQIQDNELASAMRIQIEWFIFGSTLNPIKRYLHPRPLVLWYQNRRIVRYIERVLEEQFNARMKQGNVKTDQGRSKSIVSLVLDHYLEEAAAIPCLKEFQETTVPQLRLFLFAGHDTTSSTLIWAYHLLSIHPEALSKMKEEHDTVFGTDISKAHSIISQDPHSLNQIPYTNAVIKETLRIYPPSSTFRQGRAGIELVDDDANRIPTESCDVWPLALAIQHNPRHWKDEASFIPERWLVGPEDPLYPVKGAYRPFEYGPRNCIGQTSAMLELKIALVMTVREFQISPAYEEWDVLHPPKGIKTVDGQRAYQCDKGAGGVHPADGYPCRVVFRNSEA
jgi:cytochrome P450